MTFKAGIEDAIRRVVPEITKVVAVNITPRWNKIRWLSIFCTKIHHFDNYWATSQKVLCLSSNVASTFVRNNQNFLQATSPLRLLGCLRT
jgi:hypothetical protein